MWPQGRYNRPFLCLTYIHQALPLQCATASSKWQHLHLFVWGLSPNLQRVTQFVYAESWTCWRFDASWDQLQPMTESYYIPQLYHRSGEISLRHLSRTVKGMRFYSHLQTSRLTCHSSMDAGRIQESSGSEKKHFITAEQAAWASCSHWFPLTHKSHGGDVKWSRWMVCTQRVCVIAEGPQA